MNSFLASPDGNLFLILTAVFIGVALLYFCMMKGITGEYFPAPWWAQQTIITPVTPYRPTPCKAKTIVALSEDEAAAGTLAIIGYFQELDSDTSWGDDPGHDNEAIRRAYHAIIAKTGG